MRFEEQKVVSSLEGQSVTPSLKGCLLLYVDALRESASECLPELALSLAVRKVSLKESARKRDALFRFNGCVLCIRSMATICCVTDQWKG